MSAVTKQLSETQQKELLKSVSILYRLYLNSKLYCRLLDLPSQLYDIKTAHFIRMSPFKTKTLSLTNRIILMINL